MTVFKKIAAAGILLVAVLPGSPAKAMLDPPVFQNCPSGCTCTPVDPDSPNSVAIDCPNESGVSVCNDLGAACEVYCESTLETWWNQRLFPLSASCWETGTYPGDGCWPHSLDPPVNEICECMCWVT